MMVTIPYFLNIVCKVDCHGLFRMVSFTLVPQGPVWIKGFYGLGHSVYFPVRISINYVFLN